MRRSSKDNFGNNTKDPSLSGLGCEPLTCKDPGPMAAAVYFLSALDIFFMVLLSTGREPGGDMADEALGLTALDWFLRSMLVWEGGLTGLLENRANVYGKLPQSVRETLHSGRVDANCLTTTLVKLGRHLKDDALKRYARHDGPIFRLRRRHSLR